MIRKKLNKPLRPSYAIIGEGPTEHIYFSDMRGHEKLNITIKPKLPKHSDARNIVKNALDLINKGSDKVFCIFDLDRIQNNEKEKNEYNRLKFKYKNSKIIFIEIYPCFELWFLLHFTYTSRCYSSCEELIKDLKVKIKNYTKPTSVYEQLQDKIDTAIQNCKKLENYNKSIQQSQFYTKCEIYKIVEELFKSKQNDI